MTQIAVIQLSSGPDVEANLRQVATLLEQSADKGAQLTALPENCCLMPLNHDARLAAAEIDGSGPIQDFMSAQAARLGLWILAGTVPMRGISCDKVRSASLLFDANGDRVARYDKIHMFDVELSEHEGYRESDNIEPGEDIVVADTPAGRLGLSVCYDVRFPELYRELIARGAAIVSVPSAFTVTTGKPHWELLLRARAVENLVYVIAPAQVGTHADGRQTYGHSMIIGPWGEVMACLPSGVGVIAAEVDLGAVAEARHRLPSIDNRRLKSG
ncbi:MAG: carbon-nitrogen hydrolase family protein [Gammaproteobacteria bacterium]|nr:carbon-nitrogen hydrolase family protein [Gammaproteobacteria bacterium]